jgi:hypothetical protein
MTRVMNIDGGRQSRADKARSLGLCVTCNNLGTCANRRATGGPIMFCEQFDDYVQPSDVARPVEPPSDPVTSPALAAELGLCATCAHCADCGLRGVEGGVWHCEDYA